MAGWSQTDLAAIGAADELQIAPARADGRSGQATTIWVVRVGDELYVRCYRGAAGGWYSRALRSRHGLIRAGGREREVTFEDADPAAHGEIDRAYRSTYAGYGSSYVGPMVGPDATVATLRLSPN